LFKISTCHTEALYVQVQCRQIFYFSFHKMHKKVFRFHSSSVLELHTSLFKYLSPTPNILQWDSKTESFTSQKSGMPHYNWLFATFVVCAIFGFGSAMLSVFLSDDIGMKIAMITCLAISFFHWGSNIGYLIWNEDLVAGFACLKRLRQQLGKTKFRIETLKQLNFYQNIHTFAL